MSSTRPLGPEHRDEVLRINAAAGTAVFRLDARELSRLMTLSTSHLIAHDADGRVVGYALAFARESGYDGEEFLSFRASIAAPFLYVDQIAVDRRCRGTGIGRALYDELARLGRRDGLDMLCCEVNTSPPNPDSMSFHRRIGFRPIGALSTADGREVALLSRDLD